MTLEKWWISRIVSTGTVGKCWDSRSVGNWDSATVLVQWNIGTAGQLKSGGSVVQYYSRIVGQ